jgi:transcriptional regulator with PAS, ATPase and Fis domain
VIENRCINCTNCVVICSQGAKEVKNYKSDIKTKLKNKKDKLVVGLAPSFPAFDNNLTYNDWENALVYAGFKEIYEVAWGAQLIIKEYQKLINNSDKTIISSTCPVVVNYISKYYPQLIDNLAPIVSPMGALVNYLDKILDEDTKVVLIGPCHAKKLEFAENDKVLGVLTYTEFHEMFNEYFDRKNNLQKARNNTLDDNIDLQINETARRLPIAGGLKLAVLDELSSEDQYIKAEGEQKLSGLFEMILNEELKPKFVDALFCEGCINGVDLKEKSHFKKEIAVDKYVKEYNKSNNDNYDINIVKKIDFSSIFKKDFQQLNEPTQEEIWNILKKTNKFSDEDLLDCGACGYETCKQKAVAVYQDLAELEMCLPYLISEKRNEISNIKDLNLELDSIIDSSYDGILVIDKNMNVERVNSSYLKMVNLKKENLLNYDIKELEKNKIIYPSAALLAFKEKRDITIVQNTNNKRLLTTATPVFSEDNKIMRVIVNARDIKELDMVVDNKYFSDDKLKIKINDKNNHYNNMSHIVCKSDAMKRILKVADKIADTNSTVLITGPSGVGKEVIARYIHNLNKSRKDFIKINCGAIPERLLESELFGYETGAFSGARKEGKPGIIEEANNGTLFLDEIGEMPLNMQVKLLQVIQEHKVTRIGGVKQIDVDFRLITATNRDLKKMVNEGNFREDLFYRLNVIPIYVPTLTERPKDIKPLFDYYTEVFSKKYNKDVRFSPDIKSVLLNYNWPGNVREIINLLERVIVTADQNSIITKQVIQEHLDQFSQEDNLEDIIVNDIMPLKQAVDEVEKKLLKLAKKEGKTTYEIAELLGVNQSTVVRKLKKYFH